VAKKSSPDRRSGCPVSISLDILGDRWSLLIVRDVMVRGFRTFRQFQRSGEGIATNILSDRLRKLEAAGILITEPAEEDGRSTHYRLTPKGIALAPVVLELLIWAGNNEETGAPSSFIAQMEKNREAILAETYRRWEQRDPTPLLPPFNSYEITPPGDTSPKGKLKT
jgi:DNA-binding HxlR family transcriptional regulator